MTTGQATGSPSPIKIEDPRYHDTKATYDLTIDGLHTYYVEAGDLPVLVHNCGEDKVDLYRAVGVREHDAVMSSGKFEPGANSLEGRQFAFTREEALAYADRDPSKVAILKATIDRSALSSFDFSKNIDPFIFKNGVVTVQAGEQSAIFHAALRGIEHDF